MAQPILIFSGTTGVNNVTDPTRLRFDPETGIQDLAIGHNIDVDDTGSVARRKGYQVTARTESWHSLFCDGGDCLGVTGDALSVIGEDLSYTPIRNVTPGLKMRYCQVNDDTYYSNQREIGFVRNGTSRAWEAEDYVGPTTQRTFSGPPIPKHIELHAGRLYLSKDSNIWYSEPLAYGWYDLARGYLPFSSEVVMEKSVGDGLYVSSQEAIYFLQGTEPNQFQITKLTDYPVIEDTAVRSRRTMGEGGQVVTVIHMVTKKGLCLGLPQGQFVNLTENKLIFPGAISGAGIVVKNKYIALLDP